MSDDRPKPRRPRPAPSDEGSPLPPADEPNVFRPTGSTGGKRTGGKPGSSGRPAAKEPKGPGEGPGFWERVIYGSIGSGHLATFCRQLAAYLNAGVAYQTAFASLQLQFSRSALGPVIGRLQQSVKRGDQLAEAMAREPQAFDPLFLSMIRVAEARGGIPETLKLLAKHYEARLRLMRQARSAMIYPIAVLLVASLVIALMTIWLLPMFASLLRDIAGPGEQLPLPSRILIGFSDFVRAIGWLVIPAVMVGTPIVLYQWYKTASGKRALDRVALRLPVFGPLLRKIDTSRFARALASLMDAGVDTAASLELTSQVVRMEPFQEAVRSTKLMVLQGKELSAALDTTRRFAPDVIAIVSSGEETGKIPESLDHLADDYEEQVEYTVKNLGQAIQPLILIGLGGLVLFIILAVFLPYISILTKLAGGG